MPRQAPRAGVERIFPVVGNIDHQPGLLDQPQALGAGRAGQNQASDELRPRGGEFQGNLSAVLNPQNVDLAQPQILGEVVNRHGGICDTARGRGVRLAVAGQIGRIDRTYVGDVRKKPAECAAGSIDWVQAEQGHLLIEAAGRRKGRAHV